MLAPGPGGPPRPFAVRVPACRQRPAGALVRRANGCTTGAASGRRRPSPA